MSINRAGTGPSPNTVCVACAHRSHARQPSAAALTAPRSSRPASTEASATAGRSSGAMDVRRITHRSSRRGRFVHGDSPAETLQVAARRVPGAKRGKVSGPRCHRRDDMSDQPDAPLSNAIDPSVAPSGPGCVECLATDGWWFHLRRCAQCGHVGCCDSSPSQHASRHAYDQRHPVIQSFEPGEEWFWDYARQEEVDGQPLAPPRHHPLDQPTPGPRGRVPRGWPNLLH